MSTQNIPMCPVAVATKRESHPLNDRLVTLIAGQTAANKQAIVSNGAVGRVWAVTKNQALVMFAGDVVGRVVIEVSKLECIP